jgi:hypothetical protein
MEVSIDRFRFFFDVSGLEHKKANEKRELVYTFRERRDDGTLVFSVSYSERGTQTKIDDIRRGRSGRAGAEEVHRCHPVRGDSGTGVPHF